MASLIALQENRTSSDMLLQVHFKDHCLPDQAVADSSVHTSSDPIGDFDIVRSFHFK